MCASSPCRATATTRQRFATIRGRRRPGGPVAPLPASPHALFFDAVANTGFALAGTVPRAAVYSPFKLVNLRYLSATLFPCRYRPACSGCAGCSGHIYCTVRFAEHPSRGDNSALSVATAGLNIDGETRFEVRGRAGLPLRSSCGQSGVHGARRGQQAARDAHARRCWRRCDVRRRARLWCF